MRRLLLLIVCGLQIGFAAAQSDAEVVWVDVRSWVENQLDRIDGDPNFPHEDIVKHVQDRFNDINTPIRLYCARGGRAQTALERLTAAGYVNVKNMGGIEQVRAMRFGSPDN